MHQIALMIVRRKCQAPRNLVTTTNLQEQIVQLKKVIAANQMMYTVVMKMSVFNVTQMITKKK